MKSFFLNLLALILGRVSFDARAGRQGEYKWLFLGKPFGDAYTGTNVSDAHCKRLARNYCLQKMQAALPAWAPIVGRIKFTMGNSGTEHYSDYLFCPCWAELSSRIRIRLALWILAGRWPVEPSLEWRDWFYGSGEPGFQWIRWAISVRFGDK